MRPVRDISAIENFRVEAILGSRFVTPRRDSIEPEPVGTIVAMAFRITGYSRDCDGSLMARFEAIDNQGNATGWEPKNIGLYPDTDLVVTLEEWRALFASEVVPSPGPMESDDL